MSYDGKDIDGQIIIIYNNRKRLTAESGHHLSAGGVSYLRIPKQLTVFPKIRLTNRSPEPVFSIYISLFAASLGVINIL